MPYHDIHNLYFAKGGENVAMSELLLRGYNVAVPSVDIGDDIYVVEDSESNLIRVQVKSSNSMKRRYGFSSRMRVRIPQLRQSRRTKLVFIFAFRFEERWYFAAISREQLEEEVFLRKAGIKSGDEVFFNFRYRMNSGELLCSERNFTKYLSWEREFPKLKL